MKARHRKSFLAWSLNPFRYLISLFKGQVFALIGYLGCGLSGSLVFIGRPSQTLVEQGGRWIAIAWSGLYVLGALMAIIGLIFRKIFIEVVGAGVSALVSFTWAVALVLRAVSTASVAPLTAAFVAASLAGLLAQRWVDATQILRS